MRKNITIKKFVLVYTNALLNNYMDKIKEDFNEVIIVDQLKNYTVWKKKKIFKRWQSFE